MNDMHNFAERKNRAIDELKKMNNQAANKNNFCHDIPMKTQRFSGKSQSFNFDFLTSNDDLLILGLILILYEDCQDIWLFLALIYILL